MNSTISTLSCPRKQFPSVFWQKVFVQNFPAALVNVCTSTALTAHWFQQKQRNPDFITCDDVIEKLITIILV
jgi:hypothetical protein